MERPTLGFYFRDMHFLFFNLGFALWVICLFGFTKRPSKDLFLLFLGFWLRQIRAVSSAFDSVGLQLFDFVEAGVAVVTLQSRSSGSLFRNTAFANMLSR